jgi:HSP20 family protein
MAIFRFGSTVDPFVGVRAIQRELERQRLNWPWSGESRRVGGGAYPPVNVYDSAAEILVEFEVAGVDAKDLDVSITGETLTLKGVKHAMNEDGARAIRRERGSGEFTRTVVLPDIVDGEKIQANLRDGVLRITLPKSAAAQPRQIPINACAQ